MGAILLALFFLLSAEPMWTVGDHSGSQIATPSSTAIGHKDIPLLLDRSRGKVLVVNIWATWCVPCKEEFPDLLRFRRKYEGRGLDLIFISIDSQKKDGKNVTAFLRKMKVDFETYIKKSGDDELFINTFDRNWGGAIPATFIYDREGKRVHSVIDTQTFESLSKLVAPLVKK